MKLVSPATMIPMTAALIRGLIWVVPPITIFAHYQTLATVASTNDALTDGDFKILLADDAADVVAYGRKTDSQAAVIIDQPQQLRINRVPSLWQVICRMALSCRIRHMPSALAVPASVTVANGAITGRSAL